MPHTPHRHRRRPSRHRGNSRASQRPALVSAGAGLVGLALLPVLTQHPAVAQSSANPCRAAFVATSAADALTLDRLDLDSLGIPPALAPGVLLGTTRTGFYGGPRPTTTARAGLQRADLADGYIQRSAPADSQAPLRVSAGEVALPPLLIGSRTMSAAAALPDPDSCQAEDGPSASATDRLLTPSSIMGRKTSILEMGPDASTTSQTALEYRGRTHTAVASASAVLPEIRLLDGTVIRVGGRPSLSAAATGVVGTSRVTHTPAPLTVAPGSRPGQFQAVNDHLDVPLTLSRASLILATLGRPGLTPAVGATPLSLRISPGTVELTNTGSTVSARLTVARLELLAGPTTLGEFGIGRLDVLATAPSGGLGRPDSAATPPPQAGRRGPAALPARADLPAAAPRALFSEQDVTSGSSAPLTQGPGQGAGALGGSADPRMVAEEGRVPLPGRSRTWWLVVASGLLALWVGKTARARAGVSPARGRASSTRRPPAA